MLLGTGGIAERQRQQEPIKLCLGQREGPLEFDRVLGGDDEERGGKPATDSFGGDLSFLHRLEKGCLRPRRRPVDLIRQHNSPEHRSRAEFERGVSLIEDGHAGHIIRQQVRRALDPAELEPRRPGQAPGQHRLARAGNVVQENVPLRQQADQGELYLLALADDHRLDGLDHGSGESGDAGHVTHNASS